MPSSVVLQVSKLDVFLLTSSTQGHNIHIPPPLITAQCYMPESVALSPRADNLDLQLLPPSLVQVL